MSKGAIATDGGVTTARRLEAPAERAIDLGQLADSRRDSLRRRLLAIADVVGLSAAYGVVWLVIPPSGSLEERLPLIAALPLWIVLNKILRLYDRDANVMHKSTLDEVPRIVQSIVLGSLAIFLLAEPLIGIVAGRSQTVVFIVAALVFTVGMRTAARAIVHSRFEPERCLMIGSGNVAGVLARKFTAHPEYDVELVGYADIEHEEIVGRRGIPLLGDVEHLEEIRRQHDIERVVVAFSPQHSHVQLMDVVQTCKRLKLKVSIVPRFFELMGDSLEVDKVEGMTLLGLGGMSRTHSSLMLKRAMDVAGAGIGLLFLSPVLLAVAIAVKLDSRGAVFFRQRRIGRDDEPFDLLKFRTMVEDADALKEELLEQNEVAYPMFKIADDPRVTRVGRFLRRSSLDELPQLLNVLKGDMSLVGPRPLVPIEADAVSGDWRRVRLDQPPGMTGPWQVLGRNDIPFEEMVKLDYQYLADWSLWNDFKLVLRTLPVIVRRQGH